MPCGRCGLYTFGIKRSRCVFIHKQTLFFNTFLGQVGEKGGEGWGWGVNFGSEK